MFYGLKIEVTSVTFTVTSKLPINNFCIKRISIVFTIQKNVYRGMESKAVIHAKNSVFHGVLYVLYVFFVNISCFKILVFFEFFILKVSKKNV
jgi:hypothetical protein